MSKTKVLEARFEAMRVDGTKPVSLNGIPTDSTDGVKNKKEARRNLERMTGQLSDLQYRLYAEARRGLLVVFQAMDTAGKDGVIRNVFGPLNPQGVTVSSFKQPTSIELAHDYLWRIHAQIPAKGMVRIFNRSHYEDVLVHRVHRLLDDVTLERRYRQINDFERYLTENDIQVVKFFLHISKEEQRSRLQSRLDNPDKRWKFSQGDIEERAYWDDYQQAYQTALDRCGTAHAPWYVIPADYKWYRDWAVASILLAAMQGMDPQLPSEQPGLDGIVIE